MTVRMRTRRPRHPRRRCLYSDIAYLGHSPVEVYYCTRPATYRIKFNLNGSCKVEEVCQEHKSWSSLMAMAIHGARVYRFRPDKKERS